MRKTFCLILCVLLSLNVFSQKKATSDSSNSFLADYQLSTQLRNKKGQIQKTFTRDIKILDVQVLDNRTKYHLFVLKFGFEDPKFQQFLKKIAYVFDEIEVWIDQEGHIVEVVNPEKIQQRWIKAKSKVLEENGGKVLLDYLQTVEETVYSNEELIAFLEIDKMFGVFFRGMTLGNQLDNPFIGKETFLPDTVTDTRSIV